MRTNLFVDIGDFLSTIIPITSFRRRLDRYSRIGRHSSLWFRLCPE